MKRKQNKNNKQKNGDWKPPKVFAERVNHQVPSPSIKFQIPRISSLPQKVCCLHQFPNFTPPNPNQGTKKSNHSTQAALVRLFALGKHLDVISQLEKYIIRCPISTKEMSMSIYIYIHIHMYYIITDYIYCLFVYPLASIIQLHHGTNQLNPLKTEAYMVVAQN